METWATVEELAAAYERFAVGVPGFVVPAACAVARRDASRLTFGLINQPGAVRPLPAVVLATVCGYVDSTGVYPMKTSELDMAVRLLAPSEAAKNLPHVNLRSWRELLDDAGPASDYLAFFVADLADPPVDPLDEEFRTRLA